jgi:hypothetical protein
MPLAKSIDSTKAMLPESLIEGLESLPSKRAGCPSRETSVEVR